MAEDTNINAENSDILSMATVMAISRYLATLHEPARSSGVNDTAETESLYAAAQKGGVDWLKKAGLNPCALLSLSPTVMPLIRS
jgi:hypothetical protein